MTIVIEIPPYPYKVLVSFNGSYSLLKRDVKKFLEAKDEDLEEFKEHYKDPEDKGLTKRLSSGHIVSVLGSADIGLIAHEMFHVTVTYADNLGIDFKMENHESYAYMIQHLVGVINAKIN
jgi:hypothetical protein